jgi:hypothetical protein
LRVIDGGSPQPPQRFKPPEFMLWCAKQLILAEKVFTFSLSSYLDPPTY